MKGRGQNSNWSSDMVILCKQETLMGGVKRNRSHDALSAPGQFIDNYKEVISEGIDVKHFWFLHVTSIGMQFIPESATLKSVALNIYLYLTIQGLH